MLCSLHALEKHAKVLPNVVVSFERLYCDKSSLQARSYVCIAPLCVRSAVPPTARSQDSHLAKPVSGPGCRKQSPILKVEAVCQSDLLDTLLPRHLVQAGEGQLTVAVRRCATHTRLELKQVQKQPIMWYSEVF